MYLIKDSLDQSNCLVSNLSSFLISIIVMFLLPDVINIPFIYNKVNHIPTIVECMSQIKNFYFIYLASLFILKMLDILKKNKQSIFQ